MVRIKIKGIIPGEQKSCFQMISVGDILECEIEMEENDGVKNKPRRNKQKVFKGKKA